jgi:hypothetical protein
MTKKQSRKLSRLVSKVQAPLLVTKAKKPLLVTKAKKPLLVTKAKKPLLVTKAKKPLLVTKAKKPLLVTKAKKPLLVTKAKKPLLVPMPGTKPSSYAGELLANPRSSVKTRSAAASLLRLRALLKRLRLTNRIACSKSNRTRAQPTER